MTEINNSRRYDGRTFEKREIDIPLKAVWEYLGYVETSLDCFAIAIQNTQADFFMITSQLGNYAKEKIEDFVSNNGYQEQDRITGPFEMFNNYIYYDADLLYKFAFEGEMEKYIQKDKRKKFAYDNIYMIYPKNIILNGHYRIDLYPHIKLQKGEKEAFKFITNKDVFKSLYDCAEKEKEQMADFGILLNSKLEQLSTKLNGFSEKLIRSLTNQTLLQWYVLLQKHVKSAMTFCDSTTITSKIETKQFVYIIKSLFEHCFDIDTKHSSFIEFTRSLTGTTYSTTEKYLRSPTMGYKVEAFTDNWIDSLKLLDKLDTENPKIREFIRFILREKYITKKGLSHDKQENIDAFLKKYPL